MSSGFGPNVLVGGSSGGVAGSPKRNRLHHETRGLVCVVCLFINLTEKGNPLGYEFASARSLTAASASFKARAWRASRSLMSMRCRASASLIRIFNWWVSIAA